MTLAAPPLPPPVPGLSPQRLLFDLLRRVEEEAATGLAILTREDGGSAGQLVLSRGRVCLVIPPADAVSLASLDAEDERTSRLLMDAAGEARAKDQTLCETLLRGHHLLAVRDAFRRQIAIALGAVVEAARSRAPSVEFRPARDDYDPRLMFSALEAFLAFSARLDDSSADIASRVFHEYQDSADVALLFTRPAGSAGSAVPLAARGLEQASLAAVVALGRAALGVALSFERPCWSEPPRLVSFHAGSSIWVCVLSDRKLALIRTNAGFGAGQVLGFAAALARRL